MSGTSGHANLAREVAARLERLPTTNYQRKLFLIIATAWLFDSVDLGALTFLLPSLRKEFELTLGQTGILSSASFLGMFIGAASSGMAADRWGRKRVFQFSMLLWGIGSIGCGVSPDPILLGSMRVLVGIGMGMEFPVAQAIASEITPATHRGRYIALLEGCWPLGFILAGVLTYLLLPISSWRAVFIIEGIPFLWLLVIRQRVPESPRWLLARGRRDEALGVLSSIEEQVQRHLHERLPDPKPLPFDVAPDPWSARFSQLWSGIYVRRTLMLWLLWFFALLGYYGLTTWLGALLQRSGYSITTSVLYTVVISLAGIPGFLVAAILVERWGRRPTCIIMLVGGALFAYLYGSAPRLYLLLGFGWAMQFCLFGMWSTLYAYTPELYPTRFRATGAGWASAVGRIGSLVGPSAVGLILPWGGQSAVFAFGAAAFAIAAAVVWALGEETRGRVLEEISR